MYKGIIVSIQKLTPETTIELANLAIQGGAVGIRTDQPIIIDKPIIGLNKNDKEYYITTTKESVLDVGRWADFIAIDSRKGNQEIELLYSYCHINNFKIVADIENIKDVENILKTCKKKRIIFPAYFATTFSKRDIDLIAAIKFLTGIPVIAEGGYTQKDEIKDVKKLGADNVCIGAAISDIEKLTERFTKYYND